VCTQNLGSIGLIRKILEMLEVFHLVTLGKRHLILSVPSRPAGGREGERPQSVSQRARSEPLMTEVKRLEHCAQDFR
jgi:hypothetical protein